jgi:hypothetical protein
MNSASVLELDTICLRIQNYQVVPLKPRLAGRASELEQAMRRGIQAYPDLRRNDFYDLELDNGWVYIHVRHDAQTVYLVADFSSTGYKSVFAEQRN